MKSRHPPRRIAQLPRAWLMTDERMGERLLPILRSVPRGTGVIFRHYHTPRQERRALFDQVARIARGRRLALLRAGRDSLGRCDGVHGIAPLNRGRTAGWRTVGVHDRREIVAALRAGADAIFVSPVFATRSHPGASALGRVRLGLMIRGVGKPVIALGGMNERAARSLKPLQIHGWAAIDAWMKAQSPAIHR